MPHRIARDPAPQERRRSIGRRVVDDDDLELVRRGHLTGQGRKTFGKHVDPVAGADDHRSGRVHDLPNPNIAALDVITIVASNYLAYAEVLLASVRDHHPEARCSIVVVDVDDHEAVATDHEVMTLADLGFDVHEVEHRRVIYETVEFATSVKAAALAAVLARGAKTAVYLDPDIVMYRALAGLEAMAATHQIVLTPHVVSPLPMDGRDIGEHRILVSGTFNLGFIAVSPGARPFLQFWDERLRRDCRLEPDRGLFVDQRWVDQVQALFLNTVVRDSGWNVAYWNLHERPLARSQDGTIVAGDRPLSFFHFSGHDPLDGALLSRYQGPAPRILLSEHPLVAELCSDWRERVLASGHRQLVEADRADMTALELTPLLRRTFPRGVPPVRGAGDAAAAAAGDARRSASFVDWCLGPSPWANDAGLPALLHVLWFLRPDLQAAFPSPVGADAEALTAWGRDDPYIRDDLPAEVLPDETVAAVVAGCDRCSRATHARAQRGRLPRIRAWRRGGRPQDRACRRSCRRCRSPPPPSGGPVRRRPTPSDPGPPPSALRHDSACRERRSDR